MAPETRHKNDGNKALSDSDDGGSSYFKKTVCLQDWWLVKAEKNFEGKRLAVAGYTSTESKAVRFFTSAPIVKWYDVFTLETADGICVCLKGLINKQRTTENGFSSEVFNYFYFGFPPCWEEYAKGCFGENFNTIEKEVVSGSSVSASDSDPSLISTPSKHGELVGQDKNVQMSCVENASKGPDVLNHTGNLFSMAEERSKLDIGFDMDYLQGENKQTTAAVDVSSPLNTPNLAANLPSMAEERSNLDIGVGMDNFNDGTEQTTRAVDILNASNTHNHAANSQKSIEERIYQSPSNIETDEVNVRRKKNKVNSSSYIPRNRVTRSQAQIINESQKKNSEVGCFTMQKDRASTKKVQDEQKLNRSVPHSLPSKLSHVKGRYSLRKETQRKLDFEEVASSVSRKGRGKQSVISSKSLSLKCSRSGRVLLPPLEFWRNQIPVFDQNRRITGIKEEVDAVKSSGSRSEPQKRRKLLSLVS